MSLSQFQEHRQRWGWGKALHIVLMNRLQQHLGMHFFVIQSRPLNTDPPVPQIPDGDFVGNLDIAGLHATGTNPELQLDLDDAAEKIARGDACFGYVTDSKLVAYTWLAQSTTRMEEGLWVNFPAGFSYGHAAFTLPAHRGRRLQQLVVNECDRWLTAHGHTHNIDYIRVQNHASLLADRRYGNLPIGYAGFIKWFGKVWPWRSPALSKIGFYLYKPTS